MVRDWDVRGGSASGRRRAEAPSESWSGLSGEARAAIGMACCFGHSQGYVSTWQSQGLLNRHGVVRQGIAQRAVAFLRAVPPLVDTGSADTKLLPIIAPFSAAHRQPRSLKSSRLASLSTPSSSSSKRASIVAGSPATLPSATSWSCRQISSQRLGGVSASSSLRFACWANPRSPSPCSSTHAGLPQIFALDPLRPNSLVSQDWSQVPPVFEPIQNSLDFSRPPIGRSCAI